jgi:hypothetical protein
MMAIAGSIHMPSLVFLPAYWLAQMRVRPYTLALYLMAGIALYIFRNQFVSFIRSFYYEDDEIMIHTGEIGSRLIMMDKGHIVLDKGGEEKAKTKVEDILDIFTEISIECGN